MENDASGPAVPAGDGNDTFARRYFLRNAALLALENAGFVIAITFLGTSTVLPTFVSRLGGSAFLVGLLGTCQSAGWLLPQLVGARIVAGKRRMLPYILIPLYVGRPAFLILGLLTVLLGARHGWLLLVLLYVALFGFYATDGLASVPWYELVGKTLPPNRRGRMFGVAQVGGGLGGMAVGWVVALVLGSPALDFPADYALLFGLSGAVFLVNLLPFLFVKEPESPAPTEAEAPGGAATARGFLASVADVLRLDRTFRRLICSRLLLGLAMASFPFYILFMDRALSLDATSLGMLTSAQVLGGLLGGLAVGWVADHIGTRTVIRWSGVVGALIPGFALGMAALEPALGPKLLYLAAFLFVLMGVAASTNMIGFMNYLLEVAPLERRTTYVGLFNTLAGVLLVAPPLAGWIVEAASYRALFVVAVVAALASLAVSVALPKPPRRR